MALATDVLELGATELLTAYRDGRLSPVEVLEAALARIERDDPALRAFCLVDRERALEEARASEARWRRGAPAGALDGVPVAVKDVFPTRGWPTLRGSRVIDPAGPWEDDAPAVAALRRHGAVLPGKTTTPEFGWKGVTDSPLEGVTRNPWDPRRTAGGSSGGSSAALAAGMVPLALGTDGGGSIRIPSSFCGLPGIKPTYGRVPAWPREPVRDGRARRTDGPDGDRPGAGARRALRARRARLDRAPAARGQLPRRPRGRRARACGSPSAPTWDTWTSSPRSPPRSPARPRRWRRSGPTSRSPIPASPTRARFSTRCGRPAPATSSPGSATRRRNGSTRASPRWRRPGARAG